MTAHAPTTAGPIRGLIEGRTGWALTLGVYLLAATFFASASAYSRLGFPLDDSWIHRVYARAFAHGEGFAYNPGQQETGATSPLWIIVTAPAHWLEPVGDFATVLGVKLIGVLFGALAVLALRRTLERLGLPCLGAIIAGLVFAVEPRLHFSALSGMEVVLLVWLWLETTRAILDRQSVLALTLLGLAPLARPEAVLMVPPALLALLAVLGRDRRNWPGPWTALLVVVPPGLWALYCRIVSGHWLPASFYVKAESFSFGPGEMQLAWDAITQYGWAAELIFPVALVVVASWLLLRRTDISRAALLLLLATPIVYVVGVVGSREIHLDGYYWTRWTDPAALVLTGAAALGVGLLFAPAAVFQRPESRLQEAGKPPRRIAAVVGWSIAALVLAPSLPGLAESFGERRERLSTDSRAIHLVNVGPGLWIRENTAADAVIGVRDAGAMRYFGERYTIDLIGLNNADVAFARTDTSKLLQVLDWMVVFPRIFDSQELDRYFTVEEVFAIPLEEYTVCPCPGQNANVIAKRAMDARQPVE